MALARAGVNTRGSHKPAYSNGGYMDITSAQTLVMFLAHRFGTTTPKVRYGKLRRYDGFYPQSGKEIVLAKYFPAYIVVHEFAHHLDKTNNPQVKRWHTESFYHCLLLAIDATGWKRSNYPWEGEYPCLLKWAIRDGYQSQK